MTTDATTRAETAFAEPGYGTSLTITRRDTTGGPVWIASIRGAGYLGASGEGATIEAATAAALDARDAQMPRVRRERAEATAKVEAEAAMENRFRAVVSGLGVTLDTAALPALAWLLAEQVGGVVRVDTDTASAAWNTRVGAYGGGPSRTDWRGEMTTLASRLHGDSYYRPNAKAIRALIAAGLVVADVTRKGKYGATTLTIRPDVLAAFVAAGLVGEGE